MKTKLMALIVGLLMIVVNTSLANSTMADRLKVCAQKESKEPYHTAALVGEKLLRGNVVTDAEKGQYRATLEEMARDLAKLPQAEAKADAAAYAEAARLAGGSATTATGTASTQTIGNPIPMESSKIVWTLRDECPQCGLAKAGHIKVNHDDGPHVGKEMMYCPSQIVSPQGHKVTDLIKKVRNGQTVALLWNPSWGIPPGVSGYTPPPSAPTVTISPPVVNKPEKKKITLVRTTPTNHVARPMP